MLACLLLVSPQMALNGLFCADVPLRAYSLSLSLLLKQHGLQSFGLQAILATFHGMFETHHQHTFTACVVYNGTCNMFMCCVMRLYCKWSL